ANNFAMKGKRKTLSVTDVMSDEEMEFQRFLAPLKALEAYRREQKGKKEATEMKKDSKDKKPDGDEQDKSREEEDEEEKMEEDEVVEDEEVEN
ncbi:LOW QUALITY PROTEIN: DNA polymerase epsilon subunit 3, partial [Anomaloglossus baeobatrachus]